MRALVRLVSLLLVIAIVLSMVIAFAQHSTYGSCLAASDASSGHSVLVDMAHGAAVAFRQAKPYLFTITFPNSGVEVQAHEDVHGAVYDADGTLHLKRGMLSVQQGVLSARVPIGSFYYPDLSHQSGKLIYHEADFVHIRLTPDNRYLLYSAYNAKAETLLTRVALDGSDSISRPLDADSLLTILDLSPDGQYLITGTFNGDSNNISLWETSTMKLVDSYSPGSLFSIDDTSGWSSDSSHYAFTGETNDSHLTVGIIAPDAPKRPIASDTGGFLTNAHWSPDNRFVYMDGTLLDAEHGTQYDVSSMELEFASDNIFWSADSRHLIALLYDGVQMGKVAAWQVYSLDHHQITTLHDILGWMPDPVHPSRAVIARLDPNGDTVIETMGMDGSARTSLLTTHAALPTQDADYTQMEWSPDGTWIAVPWRTPTTLKAGLTVVRADGLQAHELPDVTAWKWAQDGKTLAYLTTQAKGQTVGILNVATDEQHVVIDGARDIRFIATPDSNNLFGVWWQSYDLIPHVSAYRVDSTLVYQADDTSLMDVSVPAVLDFAADGQLVRSADGGLVLLYGVYGDYTVLVDAHNQATQLPIDYWGDVIWKHCN